jgi:hypothetical protein
MSDQALYNATRRWWKASRRRTSQVEWVFAVFAGVVRAVYRVDRWEPSEDGKRLGFCGTRDRQMEDRYQGRDVTSCLKIGAQNPLRYVNC